MRTWHYDRVAEDGTRSRICSIEDTYSSKVTEVDYRFKELTGERASDRGIVVWWEDK